MAKGRLVGLLLGNTASAETDVDHARMGSHELDSGSTEGHTVAAAHRVEAVYPPEDVGGGASVVVPSGVDAARCEDAAVKDASQDHRDAAFLAERKQIVERILFEEGVASGQQETVKIRLLEGRKTNCRFVDAQADGSDDALIPQACQRRIGTCHGFPKALWLGCRSVGPHITVMN